MTDLIVMVSTGKGTWGHVSGLVNKEKWDKIYVVTNDFGAEKFTKAGNMEFIVIDQNKSTKEISEVIRKGLEGKVSGEVGLNFISGTGKEHMALLAALMKVGASFRLVVADGEAVEEV